MRYWPLGLIGSGLEGLRLGLSGSKRNILPSGVLRFCALPPGEMWPVPVSLALPPSPIAKYMYPSGPKVQVPPLWFWAFLPKEMTSRMELESTTLALVLEIFHPRGHLLRQE